MFRFEEVQLLKVHVYDVAGDFHTSDATNLDLSQQVRAKSYDKHAGQE